MKTLPSSILLYTVDYGLAARITQAAAPCASVQVMNKQAELENWFARVGDAVLAVDLSAPDGFLLADAVCKKRPLSVVILLGTAETLTAAEQVEAFGSADIGANEHTLKNLIRQAAECYSLRLKNNVLEEELTLLKAQPASPPSAPHTESRAFSSVALQNFSRAQRSFGNLGNLFESIVEGLIATARVSRAGIFIKDENESAFIYQAGARCLAAVQELAIPLSSPFVQWLEMHSHLISRQTLPRMADPMNRALLQQMLDSLGAEIIIPLHAAGHIIGWIFVGTRATGIPFDIRDLEELTGLADHISSTLETAFHYEKTTLEKAVAETLLHAIPSGLIACDGSAEIQCFNTAAKEIVEPASEHIIGNRVEILGTAIAELLRSALDGDEKRDAVEWMDNRTHRILSAKTQRLFDGGECVGAMLMLRDVTAAKLLKDKEEQLERAEVWHEMASSLSHEIRNPLVAIKTFAQLLPERYDDDDFRSQFSTQVIAEVNRLNQLIEMVNGFANPPEPVFEPLDIRAPIAKAAKRIQTEWNRENLKLQLLADDPALKIRGAAAPLEECFYQLLLNAAENLGDKPDAKISVTVKEQNLENGGGNIRVVIADNGTGIADYMLEKAYSPFSTTKARGFGLGLPIAKRTVIAHSGQMDIQTSTAGTAVSILLPAIEG